MGMQEERVIISLFVGSTFLLTVIKLRSEVRMAVVLFMVAMVTSKLVNGAAWSLRLIRISLP